MGKNTTTLEEVAGQIPSVNVIDGQANIRGGSGWSYGAGSRVQILVDDLPQLTADAGDTKWTFLPIENLEQIEVIKGASSVLFGSSALNGIINIRTSFPKDKPVTRVNYFAGIYDRAKIKLNGKEYSPGDSSANNLYTGVNFYHGRKAGNFDLTLSGNLFRDNGYRDGENEKRGRISVHSRYNFKKAKGLSAGVNVSMMLTDATIFFLWQNDTTGAYSPAVNTLSDSRTIRTNVDPFISYVHGNSSHRLRGRWFNTTNTNNTDQDSKGDLFYSEYQYQNHFSKNITVTAGVVDIFSVVNSQLYGDHNGNQIAAYLQSDLKWKIITFSAGARTEQNKVDELKDKWTTVYRSGINFHILKETYLRASAGQGYRFPSIAEKFIRTSVGSIIIYPNSDLEAEKGFSMEAGIKQGLKIGKWKGYADFAVFRNEYDNMMEFAFAQWGVITDPLAGNGFKSVNVGSTRIDGFDISLSGLGKIGKVDLTLIAGYTYLEPRQLTYGDDYVRKVGKLAVGGSDSTTFLKYRYRHMLKADVEAKWKKIMFGVSVIYNSRMENMDYIFVSGILDFAFPPGLGISHYRKYHNHGDVVTDLRLGYNATDHLKISFIVKNVFNYIYMERPSDMQPPRSFVCQLGWNF
jgi:outer membrane receptor protein involved in Fe transport